MIRLISQIARSTSHDHTLALFHFLICTRFIVDLIILVMVQKFIRF